jgi:hypothetical protein
MAEVIRFIPKSELERLQFIREARAMYESVFPSVPAVSGQRTSASISRAVVDANVHSTNVHSGDDARS